MYALTYGSCGVWAGIIRGVAARRKGHKPTSSVLVVLAFLAVGTFSAVIGSAIIGMFLLAPLGVCYFVLTISIHQDTC